ncbi:MAG TPA: hypothetical protein VFS68_07170 [Candidatus Udaeobacter sp.]|nr:hypothetical protein [Candidatus Udaeobacter sp.]
MLQLGRSLTAEHPTAEREILVLLNCVMSRFMNNVLAGDRGRIAGAKQ